MRRPHRPAVAPAFVGLALVIAMAASSPLWRLSAPASPSAAPTSTRDVLGSLPLTFEPLADGSFASRGPGYALALSPAAAAVTVDGGTFQLRPAGPLANPAPVLAGSQPLPGTVNHLEGDDPTAWATSRPTFGSVVANQVWPGIDMVWHGDWQRLEHDIVVGSGADPTTAVLDVAGADSLRVDPSGDLLVGPAARLSRPVAYQDVAGRRQPVAAGFTLLGPSRIGFQVGTYDRSAPLVIDPTLVTSTALGGGASDLGYSIALDASGNIYVAGSTESTDFPTAKPFQAGLSPAASGPSTDVFVTKLTPDGSGIVWSTYLGGKGRDTGYAVAVGAGGAVYVAGVTESSDFPRAKAAQDNYGGGPSDAFVARIAASGAALEWSTFVGGSQTDRARGLAVDGQGNAYVTGSTSSTDFPAVNAQQPGPYRADDVDAFIVKVPAAGAPLAYATRLGGSNDDHGLAVAVDGQGAAYVTGDTLSPGFPTVRPFQPASGGSASGVAGSFPDAFVAKFTPAGSTLAYSTFLGGSDYDQGTAIAVDAAGAAYVTGSTNSPNFPTVAPLQARKDADADAFVAKLDPAGATLAYSTYLGGGGADGGNGITVDAAGDAYLVGTTGSTNWPVAKPTQATKNGGDDAFVSKLNPAGNSMLFSTYLGGRESDAGMSVAVDSQGAAHVLGLTASPDFPQVKALTGSHPPAASDAFVATLSLSDVAAPAPTTATPATVGTTSGHDRRVRALGALTVGLLVVAGAQTIYLQRRARKTGAKAGPDPRTGSRPATTPSASRGVGLRVLDDAGIGAGPAKVKTGAGATAGAAGAASKAASASKSTTRTPKARGGPKSGTGASKATNKPKTPTPPRRASTEPARSTTEPADATDGEPTIVAPPPPPPPAKPRIQEPAIAQLLEEDLWAPGLGGDDDAMADDLAPGDLAPASVELAPATPVPDLAPAIPPVPAEELSFWDLFPEDLPPARAGAFPVDDLLADHLALPDGPDSVAARVADPAAPSAANAPPAEPPPPARAPHPADAEIVIAELLDGPVPTGLRSPADARWVPDAPGDDFLISDLLAVQRTAATEERREERPEEEDGGDREPAPPQARASSDEQARVAADQARRRRARRAGKGRPGPR